MKKTLAVLLLLALMFIFALPVFAAGVDDGVVSVAEINGAKYFGKVTDKGFIKYLAADGSDSFFYDLNGDKDMNVCDLVALINNKTDINGDAVCDGADSLLIRLPIVNGEF